MLILVELPNSYGFGWTTCSDISICKGLNQNISMIKFSTNWIRRIMNISYLALWILLPIFFLLSLFSRDFFLHKNVLTYVSQIEWRSCCSCWGSDWYCIWYSRNSWLFKTTLSTLSFRWDIALTWLRPATTSLTFQDILKNNLYRFLMKWLFFKS